MAGLNQSELSRKIGVTPDYVRRWLRGERPRPEACALIADALGLRRTEVLKLAGYPVEDALDGGGEHLTAEQTAAVQAMTSFVKQTPPGLLPEAINITELGFHMVWRAAALLVQLNGDGSGNTFDRMVASHQLEKVGGATPTERLEPAI